METIVQNETVQAMIDEFAKKNRTSKKKVAELVEAIIEARTKNGPKKGEGGREPSEETLRVRGVLAAHIGTNQFTVSGVAKELELSTSKVYAGLHWMRENGVTIAEVGKVENEKGQRGRKEVIFQVIE